MKLFSIYQIFYEKLPGSIDEIMPEYTGCKLVTCLNPYYLIRLKEDNYKLYQGFDFICSDGMGPIKLNQLFNRAKSVRLSFDMSSLAGPVFNHIIEHEKSLYVLGAYTDEVEKSVKTIMNSFPGIKIVGFHDGYINGIEDEVVQSVISSSANIVIIGMGAPLQDEMAIRLKDAGFVGTVYTCGGFIHQTTEDIVSFPDWSNKLGLRWFYRIFTQKGMFKRLIQTYPKFVITYSWFLLHKVKK